jgi:serine/threonine protein kinase
MHRSIEAALPRRHSMTITSHQFALPVGTLLMEYRVSGLLGAGAFGITYLARDTHLDKDVAIKEYLPSAFAARAADGNVVPITPQQEQDYRWGLERFGQEARTLARFSHPNIVRVNRYFEANSTGYMVMDYEHGRSLKAFVQAHPVPPEADLKALIAPLLDGLEKVHASGFLHRDIKPDNIFLRRETGPVLIDFGAARQNTTDPGQALTTIVSPGYAPFEQYTTSKQQGPWSDLYSLGGVLYFLVTGHSPPDAITRMKGDTLRERLDAVRDRYSPAFLEAIAWALALEEGARPRDVAAWRSKLLGSSISTREGSTVQAARVEPWIPTIVLQTDAAAAFELHDPAPTTLPLALTAKAGTQVHTTAPRARASDWLFGQLVLIAVTAALSASIAGLPAFQETQLIEGRLGAATAVELLGAAGVVAFLWLFARGLAWRFLAQNRTRAVLYQLVMPIITLGALAIVYANVLRLLGPALDDGQLSACAWSFLLAACACAIWLSMAVFSHAEALRTLLHGYRQSARTRRQSGPALTTLKEESCDPGPG